MQTHNLTSADIVKPAAWMNGMSLTESVPRSGSDQLSIDTEAYPSEVSESTEVLQSTYDALQEEKRNLHTYLKGYER
jgi:hypothetical protein